MLSDGRAFAALSALMRYVEYDSAVMSDSYSHPLVGAVQLGKPTGQLAQLPYW